MGGPPGRVFCKSIDLAIDFLVARSLACVHHKLRVSRPPRAALLSATTMRLAALLLLAPLAYAADEAASAGEEAKMPPKLSKEEVAKEMDLMHDFWCHPGAGRAETALCAQIQKRADDPDHRPDRSDDMKKQVEAMHAAYCAVGDNAEARHPCLMWSSKEARHRKRKLARQQHKPEFMSL